MDPQKWQQVKSIFNDAVELDTGAREIFLASGSFAPEMLDEVRKMFAADREDLIEHSPFSTNTEDKVPEKIGNYRIVREVGRGGMGAVYEAMRDDGEFSQRVAVKIIKRGMDSDDILRRFRNERQILAELQHPNIARLFDGGVSEHGSPFYVMEFIEGVPIDVYCREGNITVGEKLELFCQVCAAVSYAHTQLIVHRDLKPSNIIITADGVAKLLDFGIATVLGPESAGSQETVGTATQFGMMTPAYASPEQVRGEKVTTASDVYSLGVIFYELLAGERPYRTDGKSYVEMIDLICNSALRRPSDTAQLETAEISEPQPAHKRLLKGDLDNIALKALQKDPLRRYRSAEQFSDDIHRHLTGQTISARPDTFSYRLRKFAGRNKVAVVAGALIFLSLCAGFTIAMWQAVRAEQQRALAENRFSEVRELANAVIFKYHDAIAALPGSTATREMLVRDATRYLDNLAKESAENPALQRELALAYIKLGDVQGKAYAANIGDTAGAVDSYRKAAALLEGALVSAPADRDIKFDLVKAYEALFQIYMRSDGDKMSALNRAMQLQEELSAADPGNPAYNLQEGSLLILSGDSTATIPEKLPIYEKALDLGESLIGRLPLDKDVIGFNMRADQRMGSALVWLGDAAQKSNDSQGAKNFYARALPFYERSFQMSNRLTELEPNNSLYRRNEAMAAINLAESYAKNGRRDDSMALIARCQKTIARMEEEDAGNKEVRSDIAFSHEAISKIWHALGDPARELTEIEKALEIQVAIFDDDNRNVEILGALSRNHRTALELLQASGNEQRAAYHRQKLAEINSLRATRKAPG
jgi:serine/threonine protein kinase